jgi:hypothetical protein
MAGALAGSVAPDSTKQQRFGAIGRRAAVGQCSVQQTLARISAVVARGAAIVTRHATLRTRIVAQAVSRFRDIGPHCMSDRAR